jgi:hypothetical protein
VDLVASTEKKHRWVSSHVENLSYKSHRFKSGRTRPGQLLLGIIHVLTPTLQINDMTFQPQTTTIPALLPFTIVVITAPKGTKGKNGMKRSSRMSGLR